MFQTEVKCVSEGCNFKRFVLIFTISSFLSSGNYLIVHSEASYSLLSLVSSCCHVCAISCMLERERVRKYHPSTSGIAFVSCISLCVQNWFRELLLNLGSCEKVDERLNCDAYKSNIFARINFIHSDKCTYLLIFGDCFYSLSIYSCCFIMCNCFKSTASVMYSWQHLYLRIFIMILMW